MAENDNINNKEESALSIIFPKRDIKELTHNALRNVVAPNLQQAAWNIISGMIYSFVFGKAPDNMNISINASNPMANMGNNLANVRTTGVNIGTNASTASPGARVITDTAGPTVSVIWFKTQSDLDNVLTSMRANIDRYGSVSILDYYEFCGLPTKPSDNRYGWTNLTSVQIEENQSHSPTPYRMLLPPVAPISNYNRSGLTR